MSTESPRSTVPTFLLVTPREWTPVQCDVARDELAVAVESQLGLAAAYTTLSEWYDQTYAAAGSKDAWIWETVYGRDYDTREPHFKGFCLPATRLDRTAVQVVSEALRNGNVVLTLNANGTLLQVRSIRERMDEGGGWAVSGDPIG